MLDKATFVNTLTSILSDLSQTNTASTKAQQLASAIETYVKSGTVTVAAGIAVTTSGGAGSTSGTGTGTIS